MSKSIGKVFKATPLGQVVNGVSKAFNKATGVSYDSTPANNYMSYLQNYDTSTADQTLSNLQNYALAQSGNLSNMQWNMPTIDAEDWYIPTISAEQWNFPTVNKEDWYKPNVQESDWNFNVNASDEARQRAENATYQSYLDKLTPQFEKQTSDLDSLLINKGLAVGSDAYERAMSDLQDRQNDALNQAAYASVLNGQNAYSQSLNDEIAAGNFGNTARNNYYNAQLNANSANTAYQNALLNANSALTDYNNAQLTANDARTGLINAQNAVNNSQASYLAQILGALGESPSTYDIQGDIYAVGSNKANNEYTAKQQTAANRLSLINSLLGAAGKAAGAAAGGA